MNVNEMVRQKSVRQQEKPENVIIYIMLYIHGKKEKAMH